jgi:hypothetical protein
MSKRDWKLIAAMLIVCGIVLSLIGKIFGPDEVVWHKAPWFGETADILGWLFILIAPLIYIILDWNNLFPKKAKLDD